ncbi:hypothetical protein HGRIS_003100 [Hohenbuehelia grisea]|uniref:Uncharacterized protein n=1 Tax=Hohenbuehelia grisea TaxID=104357 RepID=A0ABR3JMH1_9AGAR
MLSPCTATLIALIATAVTASNIRAPTRTTSVDLFNGPNLHLKPISALDPVPGHLTNAQRLARGLPLNPPVRRRKRHGQIARRQNASPLPPITGYISLTCDSPIAEPDGPVYISSNANAFGEYTPTTDLSEVLAISVPASSGSPTGMTALNGNLRVNFPNVVAILGFATTSGDMSPGSANYAYIGGSTSTPPGSPAVTQPNSYSAAAGVPRGVESAIWQRDANNRLTIAWTNEDGSRPEVFFAYVPGANAFIITGDPAAFSANFGTTIACEATLVPQSAEP